MGGNLNTQCLNSAKPSDNPIICEIFNDTGTYITSCYSHDRISYIKQCYVETDSNEENCINLEEETKGNMVKAQPVAIPVVSSSDDTDKKKEKYSNESIKNNKARKEYQRKRGRSNSFGQIMDGE